MFELVQNRIWEEIAEHIKEEEDIEELKDKFIIFEMRDLFLHDGLCGYLSALFKYMKLKKIDEGLKTDLKKLFIDINSMIKEQKERTGKRLPI